MALHNPAEDFWQQLQGRRRGNPGQAQPPGIGQAFGQPNSPRGLPQGQPQGQPQGGPQPSGQDLNGNGIDDALEGVQSNLLDNKYGFDRQQLQLKQQQRYWKNMQAQQKAQQATQAAQQASPLGSLDQQPQALRQWNLAGNTFNNLSGSGSSRMANPLNDTMRNLIEGKQSTGSGSSNPLGRLPTRPTGSQRPQASFSFGR